MEEAVGKTEEDEKARATITAGGTEGKKGDIESEAPPVEAIAEAAAEREADTDAERVE